LRWSRSGDARTSLNQNSSVFVEAVWCQYGIYVIEIEWKIVSDVK
jgi:hypothetical protein